jgi:hypothetical protein
MAIVAGAYLGQTTYVAGQAREMEKLERQLREMRWANNDLLLEIAQYQDMSRIEREAAESGLGPAQQFEYVEVMVDGLPSPSGGGAAEGVSGRVAVLKHLPEWLRRMLEQFLAWAAGPLVTTGQVSE